MFYETIMKKLFLMLAIVFCFNNSVLVPHDGNDDDCEIKIYRKVAGSTVSNYVSSRESNVISGSMFMVWGGFFVSIAMVPGWTKDRAAAGWLGAYGVVTAGLGCFVMWDSLAAIKKIKLWVSREYDPIVILNKHGIRVEELRESGECLYHFYSWKEFKDVEWIRYSRRDWSYEILKYICHDGSTLSINLNMLEAYYNPDDEIVRLQQILESEGVSLGSSYTHTYRGISYSGKEKDSIKQSHLYDWPTYQLASQK